jgi:aminopeptidase
MGDSRISKMAKVLVHYSLEIKPEQKFMITAGALAEELTLAIYEEALKAGGYPDVIQPLYETWELLYSLASEKQLDHVSPIDELIIDTYDASLTINTLPNRRLLSGVNPERIARNNKAYAPLAKTSIDRGARGEFRECYTLFPNNAFAQDAEMSLRDFTDFFLGACMLDEADPVACWRKEGENQHRLCSWLKGHERVVFKGSDIDLTLSIRDRVFEECNGKLNFPDGEIFTGPVEDSAKGWVHFRYPAICLLREIADVELWLENGKVVKEKAAKNEEFLTATLNTDPGARYLGEWGIGTNYGIRHFTKSILIDEKIGGTIHFAVGASYPQTGGKNESGIHWDMICDMSDSEITVDGELFYKNGKPVI